MKSMWMTVLDIGVSMGERVWMVSILITASALLSGQVGIRAVRSWGADLRQGLRQLRPAHLCALGQFCTEDVDECQLQPNACHNGGTCFNLLGGHSCVCVNGWTGESCSQNIDDCATAVCFHGATCHDRVASFYCACPMGKTGEWPFSL